MKNAKCFVLVRPVVNGIELNEKIEVVFPALAEENWEEAVIDVLSEKLGHERTKLDFMKLSEIIRLS